MICVDLAGVGMAQPDKVLFDDVSLTISSGDRVALVGVNGSGKTTLLRIIAGQLTPDSGAVRFGRDVRIAVLDQDPQLPPGTVRDFIGSEWETEAVATSLGIGPLLDRATDELSGGQAKRAALAKALVGEHDLIILDEPTNHLDLQAISWLEQRLASTKAALVFVTHDRHLMDRLTTARGEGRVVEVDRGSLHVYRAAAGTSAYAAYLDGRAARAEAEAAKEATRKILAKRELEWLQRGAQARSTKPKARLRSAREIVAGGPADAGVRGDALVLDAGSTRLGNQVIELIDVAQRFGIPPGDEQEAPASTTIFEHVDLMIEPGARLGVVGPNGAGKSTLLDIIAGRAEPTDGKVKVGKTVKIGYADQHSSDLDPEAVVRNLVAGPLREPDWRDRALLEQFWFDSTAQFAPVRMLSGGERRRLDLVMVLAAQPNVLVLDEPTNDLDLDTLRALEAFLDDWPGAVVVSSHDRTFLDRTVDHVLAIEPDEHGAGATVARVPGGVNGWLKAQASDSAAAPGAGRTPPRASTAAGASKSSNTKQQRPTPSGAESKNHGRQLRDAEQAMVKAQAKVDKLEAKMTTTNDVDELTDLATQLDDARTALGDAEEAWLLLAE